MVESKDNLLRDIEVHRKLALKAMGIFISASLLSPASGSAQGARIAERCKEQKLKPIELRMALFVSDDLIETVANKATALHANKDNAPDVTVDEVKKIILFDFKMAEDLMILDVNDIKEIYERYETDYIRFLDISQREGALKNHISNLLSRPRTSR